jgi:general secretion pathway protein F
VPVFAFKGVDNRGKPITGTKDADSPKGLRAILRRDGIIVTDVTEAKAGKGAALGAGKGLSREVNLGGLFQRVKKTEIAAFTRQLATLVKAGIPLADSLGALVEQIENPKLKTIIGDVRTRIQEGSSLADALTKHGAVFDSLFCSMVRAGETAGNLDQVLSRLADFMESQVKLRSKVGGAMVYPVIMATVSAIVLTILMVAVVPQITTIYKDNAQTLPWNTRLLIFMSHMLGGYWFIVFPLIFATIALFFYWIRSPKGRPIWDRVKLKIPIAGSLARQIAIARFTRTLGTMLSSGVQLLRALDISKDILGNVVLEKAIGTARESIQQGASIANTLRHSGHFPPVVTHMIAVGEKAGQLEQMLTNVADSYESEIEMKLSRLTTILEPLMIVFMGGAVAFVVFSILMPIMDLNPGL